MLCFVAYGDSAAPLKVSVPTFAKDGDQACPSSQVLSRGRQSLRDEIAVLLEQDQDQGLLTNCPCGGPDPGWRKIATLNMSDPDHQCPPNWNLVTSPVRGCGHSTQQAFTCDSAIFPSNGQSYSRVCGRVNGYQKGTPNAFNGSIQTTMSLESAYIDGVSLTHGAAGSREHIWSFAAAVYDLGSESAWICNCTNTNQAWPYQVPYFVQNSYFCATGNVASTTTSGNQIYSDDPLWDGEGCGATNACCQFNTPPWFCTTLPQPTTDDLELRICHDQGGYNEDVIISLTAV